MWLYLMGWLSGRQLQEQRLAWGPWQGLPAQGHTEELVREYHVRLAAKAICKSTTELCRTAMAKVLEMAPHMHTAACRLCSCEANRRALLCPHPRASILATKSARPNHSARASETCGVKKALTRGVERGRQGLKYRCDGGRHTECPPAPHRLSGPGHRSTGVVAAGSHLQRRHLQHVKIAVHAITWTRNSSYQA